MSTKYTYSKENDFPNRRINLSTLQSEIEAAAFSQLLDHINVVGDNCDIWFVESILSGEQTTLSGIVAAHTGEASVEEPVAIKIQSADEGVHLHTDLFNEWRDRSGKLRVHQTSRKLGTMILWTGAGDNPDNPSAVGGGESFTFDYRIGQTEPLVKYIDFNVVENETWLHEGYITWQGGQLDTMDLQMVPRTVSGTVDATGSSFYNIYGGYLVVPAAGNGYWNLQSDITQSTGGLVYIPNNDLDEPPTAFWNADWNSTTKQFENITAAPAGNGRYNMFTQEVIFAHFVRKMPLLGAGFLPLNSSDTDQLGHGMRLKMMADVNLETADDHDLKIGCLMCLHRASST